ncbi:MAG: hypothetical protein JNN33_18065 [Rhodospirillaceae bacterium]|jgi:hypothetical protein|nr:hypothetical protein [Rhodospirillaceae bacterium]
MRDLAWQDLGGSRARAVGKPPVGDRFHRISIDPPSFQHARGVSTRAPEAVEIPADSAVEGSMVANLMGWWQQFRTRRRHRQDIQAFNRLMDARAARRAA